MNSADRGWVWYAVSTIGRFCVALVNVRTAKERIMLPFSRDWDAGIPTAEDVKFSQEIWRKE